MVFVPYEAEQYEDGFKGRATRPLRLWWAEDHKRLLTAATMPKPTEVNMNWYDYLPTEGDDADWNDDYSPTAEDLENKELPEADECEAICANYEFDWGWELHKYARLNRPVRVRKVLRYTITLGASKASGKDWGCLNWQEEPFGHTALWWTACHGNWELTKELLDVGCDPNIADADGYTPIIVAAQEGHDECVQILLAYGADANHKMADGDTALDKAEAYDRDDCIDVLKGELLASRDPPRTSPRPSHCVCFSCAGCLREAFSAPLAPPPAACRILRVARVEMSAPLLLIGRFGGLRVNINPMNNTLEYMYVV